MSPPSQNKTEKKAVEKSKAKAKAKPKAKARYGWVFVGESANSRAKSKTKTKPKASSRGAWVEQTPRQSARGAWVEQTPRQSAPKNVYQFKITLIHSNPPIWRRILVPEHYNFWEFHSAVQSAMGWRGNHNHQFEVADKTTKEIHQLRSPFSLIIDENDKSISEKDAKISTYFTAPGDKGGYMYDSGDSWEHVIEFEESIAANSRICYPKCIQGERACPPEDCGGIDGYERLLEIIANPKHAEYQDMKEWLKESYKRFNPNSFNPKGVVFRNM